MTNGVWDIVPRPEGKSVVTSKWIYKVKHNADGSIGKSVVTSYTMLEPIKHN